MMKRPIKQCIIRRGRLKPWSCGLFAVVLSPLMLFSPGPMRAAEPTVELPKDGTWVRYVVNVRREDTMEEWTSRRRFALVGTVVENERTCRWVESEETRTINGKEEDRSVVKWLIPEQDLLLAERPMETLIRAWIDDVPPIEWKFNVQPDFPGVSSSADHACGRDVVMFPGPQRKTKPIAEGKVVEFQRGRLEIVEGRTGKHVSTRRAANGREGTFELEYTVWNHPAVPLGFAASNQRTMLRLDGIAARTISSEWTLEDFGTDAKSALPDNN